MDSVLRDECSTGSKRGPDVLHSGGATLSTRENGGESKKFKRHVKCAPSRVLHIRKLPEHATEAEVVTLALHFGRITNVLMLKGKSQAFLEMATLDAAIAAVSFYKAAAPVLRRQPVYLQYSTYQELHTDGFGNQKAQAALSALNSGDLSGISIPPSAILHIIVDNLLYPISLEVLHQLFSKYGTVLKVIIFNKNNLFQSLVQFADAAVAMQAKMMLDAQNIYNGCCTLRVGFSKLTTLNIKFNSDKSRDFTCPDLPSGDGQGMPGIPGPLSSSKEASLLGLPMSSMASSVGSLGVRLPLNTAVGAGLPGSLTGVSPVLLVSNLSVEMITPQKLFNLFGMYGDVHRVKILFNKKDTALIQTADGNQAQIAMSYLNGQKLYGKVLRVSASRFPFIQARRDDSEELTRDYTTSSLHRFSRPGTRGVHHIYPPSATLHLANIQQNITEDDITQLFETINCTVKAFKFFVSDHRMALVQLGSLEESLQAMAELHNVELAPERLLRISFSKSVI
uniref:polypyrimidine tract-binding protein 2-like n=1 Tax=Myxine glutinosa TaxID=7769 RepID=UPI00358E58F2